MDQRPSVLAGVTKALKEVGEDLIVTRKVTTKDPDKPTQPGIDTIYSWTGRGYVYPLTKWDTGTQTLVTTTMVIFDKLSLKVNEGFPDIECVTQPGDIITDERGLSYKLLDSQAPRLNGDDMAFIHPIGAA